MRKRNRTNSIMFEYGKSDKNVFSVCWKFMIWGC